jgi:histidinol-phosphate aminotransferase
MPLHLRTDLQAIPAYRAGKPARRGEGPSYKLSSNENPFPPLDSVVQAVVGRAQEMNYYPDMGGYEIISAISERVGTARENVVLGAGSVEIVSSFIRACCDPGDDVVFAWRSFEAYPLLATAAGARPVMVPLTADHRHDLPAMLAAIGPRTRVVLVCNPNNPTGTTISDAELTEFLDAVPSDVLVVIDEAYVHFNHDPESPNGVDYFRRYPNVAVAHTFSKAYGLAGMRIGYALAPVDLADALRKVALPFGVTTLAQTAAIASLQAEAELQIRIDAIVLERDRLRSAVLELGYEVAETEGNFIWLPLGERTGDFAAAFERAGVMIRPFDGEGIRVTVGTPASTDAVVDVLKQSLVLASAQR